MTALDPEKRERLLALYTGLEDAVAAAGPVCQASGRCCRFTEYGHTLFLSEIEARFLFEPGIAAATVVSRDGCPYQVDGLCAARDRRPLGCRVYFCDPAYAQRQVELAEEYLQRLKRLHEEWNEPWRYAPLAVFANQATRNGTEVSAIGPPVDLVEIT